MLARTLPYESAPTYCEGLGFIPITRKYIFRTELQYKILQKALEIEELFSSSLPQNSEILQAVFVAFVRPFRVNFPHCMAYLVMQFL